MRVKSSFRSTLACALHGITDRRTIAGAIAPETVAAVTPNIPSPTPPVRMRGKVHSWSGAHSCECESLCIGACMPCHATQATRTATRLPPDSASTPVALQPTPTPVAMASGAHAATQPQLAETASTVRKAVGMRAEPSTTAAKLRCTQWQRWRSLVLTVSNCWCACGAVVCGAERCGSHSGDT